MPLGLLLLADCICWDLHGVLSLPQVRGEFEIFVLCIFGVRLLFGLPLHLLS